jgi:hypothetical protein
MAINEHNGRMGKVIFTDASDEVREFADNYSMMSSEEEVLLDIEFVGEVFTPDTAVEWKTVDQELYDLLTEASDKGAAYLMLTP